MNLPTSLQLLPKYKGPSAWWEHVPTAHLIIELIKPKVVVELGTHYGVSFFSFCEAAEKYANESYIYGIDTWSGDKQAGYYGDEVYMRVKKYLDKYHSQRAQMVRCSFNEAESLFNKNSIDLIHIDGLHTYEAVKEDYETWLPKLKEGGTLLFHDWNVRKEGFGVWKLWEEIKCEEDFICIGMEYGYGLGIATKTKVAPEWHKTIKEYKEALKCKGKLLAELNKQNEYTESIIEKRKAEKIHMENLEQMVITQQAQIDATYQENQRRRNKGNIMYKLIRKLVGL
jgi:hypothetical protein